MNITFLGLGAMGRRMAEKLLASGHNLTVWNRDLEKAHPLIKMGAEVADSLQTSVQNADVVVSMVTNDEASKDIWLDSKSGILRLLPETAIAIECSTLSHQGIRDLSSAFKQANRKLLEAPLAGSRPQAEAQQLIFFVGGNEALFYEVTPLLLKMGANCHYCGEIGAAAQTKLLVNTFLAAQVALLGEFIGAFENSGANTKKLIEIFSGTPVCSPATKIAAGAMLSKQFAPLFPIDLVAKDLSYATQIGNELPMTSIVKEVFFKAQAAGFGNQNITGVVNLFKK